MKLEHGKEGGEEESIQLQCYTDTIGTRAHWVAVRIIVLFEQLTRRSERGDGFCRLAFCAQALIYIYISSTRLRRVHVESVR